MWAQTNGLQRSVEVSIGRVTVPQALAENIRVLSTATLAPTSGNYDSFDNTIGTSYLVPASRFLASEFHVAGDLSSDLLVEIGYGDTHVEDSATPPTNAVIIGYWTWQAGGDHHDEEFTYLFPAGVYPYARVVISSGGSSTGTVMIYGVETN